MGGQIMPPVMGAVAFIMAETLNVPYAEVVKAAIIPAILYFGACFWMVHLEAGKSGLAAWPSAELPSPWDADPPALAADPAARRARLPALRRLHADLRRHHGARADRRADPRHAARRADRAAAPSASSSGSRSASPPPPSCAAASTSSRWSSARSSPPARSSSGGRETLRICLDSLAEGAKNALPVGIACAIVGIVIGTLTLTGIASTFIGAIIAIGEDNLFLSLVLTMITCLVLGMGIPTIPNYIITSSLAGPALLALGVPLLVSHMFVFYFGIMADLTPPVALAAFAAAPMAKVSGMKIGCRRPSSRSPASSCRSWRSSRPALMLQDGGADRRQPRLSGRGRLRLPQGLPRHRRSGARRWSASSSAPMRLWERLARRCRRRRSWSLALPLTDEAGFALWPLVVVGWHWWRARAGRRRHEPLHPRRRRDAAPRGRRLHPRPGPIRSSSIALGGGLAGRRPPASQLVEARVQGSGAGMEPPPTTPASPAAGGATRPDRRRRPSSSSPPPAPPAAAGRSAPPAPAATSAPRRAPRSASPPATDAGR